MHPFKSNSFHYIAKSTQFLALFLIIGGFLRFFVFELGRVNGRSMENTLFDAEFFAVDKITLLIREPHRGDIVQIFQNNSQTYIVKRIIGLPGEGIAIRSGVVYVTTSDGTTSVLDETYKKPSMEKTDTDKTYQTLGKNEYFVLGDNREQSSDSRTFGPVSRTEIQGKIILFPWNSK